MISTAFQDPGTLVDGELHVRVRERFPGDASKAWVPAYRFDLVVDAEVVGDIELRLGATPAMVSFGGQVAYGVRPQHRGHHYAARSLRLLTPLARAHGMTELWITCNPDNWASRRTCELAGGELVETVDLPRDSDMYLEGERRKCRYRIDLSASA